ERLSGHGSLGLSSSSAAYTTHSGGHTGRSGPATGHSGHSGTHGSAATMHHQSLQSDFQPPYFPPPFHHSTQSPPQQQNLCALEYWGADRYNQPLSSLQHAPLHQYNLPVGLRSTRDQLGIHRTHREALTQRHVESYPN
ncbi:GL20666, partial [Drosophila persimilis]